MCVSGPKGLCKAPQCIQHCRACLISRKKKCVYEAPQSTGLHTNIPAFFPPIT